MNDRLRPLWDFDDLETTEKRLREQLDAETFFQRADRARQRRLRDVQRGRRAAEMQPLGNGDKMAQLAQVRCIHA